MYYNLACNTGIVEMWAVPSRDLQDSSAVGPAIPIYSWESGVLRNSLSPAPLLARTMLVLEPGCLLT